MREAYEHCEALVRAADKDRYLATLFAPQSHRPALYALYAFNSEIARVREVVHEPLPGEIRLQWWRDTLSGGGDAAAAPVAAAVCDTIARHALPLDTLMGIIDAHTFDLYDAPMTTLHALEAYCTATASAVMALAARILGGEDLPGLEELTRPAGLAHALAGLLDAFAVHARRRQLYVPLELLEQHGVAVEDVYGGMATPALHAALAALRKQARDHLTQARAAIARMPITIAPAILPAALARPTLDRLERRDPFTPSPLPQWRRQWLLLRAAHNPRRIAE